MGLLATLCLLGTGYYAWTLYDAHYKQVAEWNEGAKAAFEEALWMEVNKRAEVPIYYSSNADGRTIKLKEEIPDSIFVMTPMGRKGYRIEKNKYNLFGYGAYDSNPYNGAYTFENYSESIFSLRLF